MGLDLPVSSYQLKVCKRALSSPIQTANGLIHQRRTLLLAGFAGDLKRPISLSECAPMPDVGGEDIGKAFSFLSSLLNLQISLRDLQLPANLPCTAFALSDWVVEKIEPPAVRSSLLCPMDSAAAERLLAAFPGEPLTFKFKAGILPMEEELDRFGKIYSSTPQNCRFRIDPNRAWSLEEARLWEKTLLATGLDRIDFVEEPCACASLVDLVELSHALAFPVAADESLRSVEEIRQLSSSGWNGWFVLKASLLGNPKDWLSLLQPVADRCVISSVFESDIGLCRLMETCRHFPNTIHGLGTRIFFEDTPHPLSGPQLTRPAFSELLSLWENA